MAIVRAQVIQLMRGAFRRGQSASSFISDMRAKGLSYRRTDMLADWRSVNELEAKKGLMRYVRKTYYPSKATMAEVEWEKMKHEYMYKVRIETRLRPDEPVTERFVNVVSDTPLTPAMVEQTVTEKWSDWDYTAESLEQMTVWTAIHKTV